MEHKHTKKLFEAALLVCVFAVVYWVWGQQSATDELPVQEQVQEQTAEVVEVSEKTRPPLEGPEDWEEYWNDELGIGFRYPSAWSIREGRSIQLRSGCNEQYPEIICDYHINVSPSGAGLRDAKWTHPKYVIGGFEAKTWQTERPVGDGYEQVISANGFRFHVYTRDVDLTDTLLSTVLFY